MTRAPVQLTSGSNQTRSEPSPRTVVVVGNGPVGHAFLRRTSEIAGGPPTRIVVLGEEGRTAYDRARLTTGLGDGSEEDLTFADAGWYADHGMDLHVGDPAVQIDRHAQQVRTRSGQSIPYDELVLATGSRPDVPKLENADVPGVLAYRTIDDLRAMRARAAEAKSVAVLGGGLLGLEIASALRALGLETHVVEIASVLVPKQLDTAGANLLERLVGGLGIEVHLLERATRVLGETECRGLEFDNGTRLDVEMVVIATGIRPRDELARDCEIEVGPRGGIVVDDHLRTSDPHVHAIGDCALHRDVVYGLTAPGYRMADVLARRLSGEDVVFEGSDESARLNVPGVEVAFCGNYLDPSGCVVLVHETEQTYRKLVLKGYRLVGAMAVGPFPELPRIQEGIEHRRRVPRPDRMRFEHVGELWVEPEGLDIATWPADAVICGCKSLTLADLDRERDDGATTLEALVERTGGSTVCGSCHSLMAAFAGRLRPEPTRIPWRTLLVVSLLVIPAAIPFALGPIPFATSVQSAWYSVEALWRDDLGKQITGFTLLGLTVLALTLSLRKRVTWLQKWGSLPWWRIVHAGLGVTTLVALAAHTGLHLGANLNFCLMLVFLAINVLGAASGVLASLESGLDPRRAEVARRWRPRLVWLHTLAFWPFPLLVTYHVLAFYYL